MLRQYCPRQISMHGVFVAIVGFVMMDAFLWLGIKKKVAFRA